MLLCFFSLTLICSGQFRRPDQAWNQPFPPGELLTYGEADSKIQFGELRLPSGKGPHPIVVLIHGGCWSNRVATSDPRNASFEYMRPLAIALAEAGVATWNIEYRRTGDVGGGWPGTFQDVGLAVDYLRSLARSKKLDLKSLVVAGHSSGGHLAFWTAARHRLPKTSAVHVPRPLRVKGAVNLDGVPDVAIAQPLERKFCPPPEAITRFMGGTPTEHPDRYRDASPTAFLPTGVRQAILAAGLVNRNPSLVTEYDAAAKAKGEPVTVETIEKTGHFDLLFPELPEGKRSIEMILRMQRERAALR